MKMIKSIYGLLLVWNLFSFATHAQQLKSKNRIAILVSDNYSKPLSDAIIQLEKFPDFDRQFEVLTANEDPSSIEQADLVVCYVHTGQVIQRYTEKLKAIVKHGGKVYAVGITPEAANYQAWGMQFDSKLDSYFENPSSENLARMVQLLCDRHLGSSFQPEGPITFPNYAIVDWQTNKIYQDTVSFKREFQTLANAPWIGIYGFRYEFVTGQYDYLKTYAKALTEQGFNVLMFYGFPLDHAVQQFCIDSHGQAGIEVLLNTSSLPGGSPEKLSKIFSKLGVPVINGITYAQNKKEWDNTSIGLNVADRSMTLARPEIMGQIQPTILATQEILVDNLGNSYKQKKELPDRVPHLVEKIKAWAAIRKKSNDDKKVTLIYYNGHPGKHNIGASYLNVLPKSIFHILGSLGNEGYDLGRQKITEKEVFNRVMSGGRNIGTWAPAELSRMVREDQPILIPIKQYKEWFSRLNPDFQEQVIKKWGIPDSSQIMTWTNGKQQKFFVLPQVRFGHINLMPQPARGWEENEEALFHDVSLPPHHQYIAFYLYLQQKGETDALIHLGTHGTLEWLSGREAGMDGKDASDALLGSMINIYPYIMDNVGEGTQAKRRGGAVIIDHLTPPFQKAGLRPELRELAGSINDFNIAKEKSPLLAQANLKSVNHWAKEANIARDLNMSEEILESDIQKLEHYLQELNEKITPMGMHTFGISPTKEQAFLTAEAMASKQTGLSANQKEEFIAEYLDKLLKSGPSEMQALLDALDGKYVEPGLGNDPIRNPDALPTGKNFYAFDPSRMPSPEIFKKGQEMAEQLIKQYTEKHHGAYPEKVAFNLWSVETIRHEGIMESQILSLLGVKPTYDGFGKISGLELIPRGHLKGPRVDIVVTPSGLYRDMFPNMMTMLDNAVSLAYSAEEKDNIIRTHVDATQQQLEKSGVKDADLRKRLALVRLFGSATGSYGIGVDNAVQATDKWEDNKEIAEVYFNRSGHLYGQGFWGVQEDQISELKSLALSIFKKALSGTNTVVHSRSTNVYGALDNDDFFQYLGGMTLAIKTIDGKEPDVIISNLIDPANLSQESLGKFIGREMNTRYLNPEWIKKMMDEGYAGARMIGQVTDNMWGWQATTDQAIRAEDWQQWHDVYVADKYDLDIKKRFADAENTYAYQNMLAKMLEVVRKEYWKPDEETKNKLISSYLETVEATGLSCSDQVCNNGKLLKYIESNTYGATEKNSLWTLHQHLGNIYSFPEQAPLGSRPNQKNISKPSNQNPRKQKSSAKPDVSPTTNSTVKGFKMEEKTLLKNNNTKTFDKDMDWRIIVALGAVFTLALFIEKRR
ncbi:cobaltochelatase subunit CobN [Sphingobacterium mizutaii]|uniref:cobaltochelatase subunit CobN n=2 Tax=Sphingobacterium TaxID=28453 RepID=UPI0016293700|nr:cobaltochelatase subunit CobN [Sphingobacterium mizutaii]